MPETAINAMTAILLALFPVIAPILGQVVKLVHALRAHPHPKVRDLAREKLPPPQTVHNGQPQRDQRRRK